MEIKDIEYLDEDNSIENDNEFKEIKKSLKCPICIDIIYQLVILSCSHQLCFNCYNQLQFSKSRLFGVTCPTCRHITPKDYFNKKLSIGTKESKLIEILESVIDKYEIMFKCYAKYKNGYKQLKRKNLLEKKDNININYNYNN